MRKKTQHCLVHEVHESSISEHMNDIISELIVEVIVDLTEERKSPECSLTK